ncbi:iron chelate uptake ABC transporter family permease subunit [Bacteroidota bacterium]
MKSRNVILFFILLLIVIFLFIIDIFFGSVNYSFNEIIQVFLNTNKVDNIIRTTIFDFRLPKAITAILVGIALSLSGLQMQTVFRNPLAGPYVLGISSGASLGVALVVLGLSPFLAHTAMSIIGNTSIVFAAIMGSCAVLFLILMVSFRIKDIMTILILGILFASATSAIVSILQYFSKETLLKAYVIWSMGSLADVTKSRLVFLSIFTAIGIIMTMVSAKTLNALLLGEIYAKSMGVNITSSRIIIFISTGIMAGTVTAFCGPIGFIGIIIPHITRMAFKTSNHFIIIPGSILIGAAIMVLSDLISQLPGTGSNLPINSVTAMIGIPIVIWIIYKRKKISM